MKREDKAGVRLARGVDDVLESLVGVEPKLIQDNREEWVLLVHPVLVVPGRNHELHVAHQDSAQCSVRLTVGTQVHADNQNLLFLDHLFERD